MSFFFLYGRPVGLKEKNKNGVGGGKLREFFCVTIEQESKTRGGVLSMTCISSASQLREFLVLQ